MKRFFERIRQKALDVRQAPVLIVAFGDSNTQGTMEHRLLAPDVVHHHLLQQMIQHFYPTTTFSTLNAGVSGDAAKLALERIERDVLRHQPDLVLVSFGGNDAGGGEEGLPIFKESLKQILSRIRQETESDVLLYTPIRVATKRMPNVHPEHQASIESIIQTQAIGTLGRYVETTRTIARDMNVPLVDVHREWIRLAETGADTDLWLINGLNHPDHRGHRIIAQLAFHMLLSQRDLMPNP
jgi:acyl-CoA thioesterase-1